MALTLFVVIASQISKILDYAYLLLLIIPIYIAYMLIVPFIGLLISKHFKLSTDAARAIIFSGGTRNSLVVLPLALALPNEISTLVAATIVTQALVEIFGELFYIKLIPKIILPDK